MNENNSKEKVSNIVNSIESNVMQRSENKFKKNIIGIVFFTVVMLVIGIFTLIKNIGMINNSQKKESNHDTYAIATISKIDYDKDGPYGKVYIEYNVDGKTYSGKLNYYSSNMKIGQEIKIKYDKENPSKFYSNPFGSNGISPILFILPFISLLIIAVITGVIVFIVIKMNKKNNFSYNTTNVIYNSNNPLKNTGVRVVATINDVKLSDEYVGATRTVVCTFTDLNGNIKTVESDPVYDSLELYFKERNVRTIDVYLDQYNNSKYFVDIDSMKK